MAKDDPKLKGYFEEYRCGCVSETVRRKRDLLGYCPTHGEDRRQVWPDIDWIESPDTKKESK